MVFGHEATLSLILPDLERLGGPSLPPSKLFFVVDHFAPPSSPAFADIAGRFRRFCLERKIPFSLMEGIGHRLMLESDRIGYGAFVAGADSHTTTVGGKGALGIGFGSTDILAVLLTGSIWMEEPGEARVVIEGTLPRHTEPKDLVLGLLRDFGQAGFRGEVISFTDNTSPGMSTAQRAVLTNMSVETGAVSGLFGNAPDGGAETGVASSCEKTFGAGFSGRIITIKADEAEPLVARPGAPDDVVPVREVGDVWLDTVVIGSCASGAIEDLEIASNFLERRRVSEGVNLLVTPSTAGIMLEAIERGLITRLVQAGAVILNPSCGACGGIDKGIPGTGENILSTAPRNFSSRTRPGSNTYLASTSVAAASALAGRIVHPEEATG